MAKENKLLTITNLCAKAKDKQILKGVNLAVKNGEVHVIMGPNGAGKSTLASVIMSSPFFEKTDGKIEFDGEDITNCLPNQIAKKGIFFSFQSPEEIDGVSVFEFVKEAKSKLTGEKIFARDLLCELENFCQEINMPTKMIERNLNVGFSGGEKKKNEILQMLALKPKLAILDEIDSGLDVDAIKSVAKGIELCKKNNTAIIIITHSTKLLKEITPDFVHVLIDGKIVRTANALLADEIDANGYQFFRGANG